MTPWIPRFALAVTFWNRALRPGRAPCGRGPKGKALPVPTLRVWPACNLSRAGDEDRERTLETRGAPAFCDEERPASRKRRRGERANLGDVTCREERGQSHAKKQTSTASQNCRLAENRGPARQAKRRGGEEAKREQREGLLLMIFLKRKQVYAP